MWFTGAYVKSAWANSVWSFTLAKREKLMSLPNCNQLGKPKGKLTLQPGRWKHCGSLPCVTASISMSNDFIVGIATATPFTTRSVLSHRVLMKP
ncbi:hypothetical protein D3C78_1386870 [compost metagenome]